MKNNSILINEIRRLEQDNTRLLELVERLNNLLLIDDLTNIYGKRFIKEVDKRFSGKVAVAMGDIDYFKKINDIKGHLFGDEVIVLVAKIIKDHVHGNDAVIRFGGDEFIIVYANASIEQATQKTEEIRQYVSEELKLCFGINVSMSFGVCEHDVQDRPFASSLITADHRLYLAKLRGRNRVISDHYKEYNYHTGKGLKMVPRAISNN